MIIYSIFLGLIKTVFSIPLFVLLMLYEAVLFLGFKDTITFTFSEKVWDWFKDAGKL